MIDELEKQIAWQNINTSEKRYKILSGKAVAIESETINLNSKENINSIVVNFENIKVLIPYKNIRTSFIEGRRIYS